MDKKKDIGHRIIDKLSNSSEFNSEQEFQDWMKENPENKGLFQKLLKIWKGIERIANADQYNADNAWQNVNERILRRTKRKQVYQNILYASAGMAASILIVFSLLQFTNLFNSGSDLIEFTTNNGGRSEVILPDGSFVRLNSGSKITFQTNSHSKTREVSFSGEGFFEVAKSKYPFKLKIAEGMQLKVLGTKFNLYTYPENNRSITTLVEGEVELTNKYGEKLNLKAGKIAYFNKTSHELTYQQGNPNHMLGWLNNKFYLDKTSLKEMCNKLEHRFDVDISIQPLSLGDKIHYTGVIEERTIDEILDALKELSDIEYSAKGRNIIISK